MSFPNNLSSDFSAQRLTASEVKARLLSRHVAGVKIVCSTPYGIRGKSTYTSQQNGRNFFRAQRLTASEVKAQVLSVWQFGDNFVLNALRHQR